MDAVIRKVRNSQLSELMLWARKVIVTLEATEGGSAGKALHDMGWDEREEDLKAKLERLIVCADRAIKKGGIFTV